MKAATCAKRSALIGAKEKHDENKWKEYLRLVQHQQSGHQSLSIGQRLGARS